MSPAARSASLLRRLPTVLRTLRELRSKQALAQIRHMLFGVARPRRVQSEAPVLAVGEVDTAFLAPPAHVDVRERAEGLEVTLLARSMMLGNDGVDWGGGEHGPLFAYHLHEQAYLRHAAVSPDLRAQLIRDWIREHPKGVGWDPHPISLRLLAWSKLLLTPSALPRDPDFRETMLRSMGDQAATLLAGLEVRLQANHLLSNRIGVAFAGLLFDAGPDADRLRAQVEPLCAELDAQVHLDGGHEERSPMYHSLLLESVLDLLNLAKQSPRTPAGFVASLERAATRMLEALATWTGPDGRISLFADSAWDIASEPAALFDYARRLGLATPPEAPRSHRLRGSGYARLVDSPFDLIASLEGPCPSHQPGHAHCDALAFELFVDDRRLITDTGVFEYRPGARRDRARTTAAHSTLQFGGREQSEIWSAHRVGGRAYVGGVKFDATGSLSAFVEGWQRGTPLHRRHFELRGGGVEIRDHVEASDLSVESRLFFDPAWRIEIEAGRAIAQHESDALRVRIDLPEPFAWRVASAPFFPTFHAEVDRPVLVGVAQGAVDAVLRFERA